MRHRTRLALVVLAIIAMVVPLITSMLPSRPARRETEPSRSRPLEPGDAHDGHP